MDQLVNPNLSTISQVERLAMADMRPSSLPPCLCLVCYLAPEQPLALSEKWVSKLLGQLKRQSETGTGIASAAGSKNNAGNTSWRANAGLMASYLTSY